MLREPSHIGVTIDRAKSRSRMKNGRKDKKLQSLPTKPTGTCIEPNGENSVQTTSQTRVSMQPLCLYPWEGREARSR
jgi:hypothetical protein